MHKRFHLSRFFVYSDTSRNTLVEDAKALLLSDKCNCAKVTSVCVCVFELNICRVFVACWRVVNEMVSRAVAALRK